MEPTSNGELLVELAEAVRALHLDQLDDQERSDLDADLQTLETQARSRAALPGVRRALRTFAAVAEEMGVGAAARLIIGNTGELTAALA